MISAFLTSRSLGSPPWQWGRNLPRRRFGQVAMLLAPALELIPLYVQHGCPFASPG